MFDLFASLLIAQESAPLLVAQENRSKEELLPHQVPQPGEDQGSSVGRSPAAIVTEPQEVRPLPGSLNEIPVFNSNSPEVIAQEGILLSTFPKAGKSQAIAHLETPLEGRFDIFTHHISRPATEQRTLYQGLLVNNPTGSPRTLKILQGISYLNSKDAPFRELLPFVEDPQGHVYSGPGSRLVSDTLRGKSQTQFPEILRIPPYSTVVLANLPIPVSGARSTYLQVETDGSVYLANLAKYEVREEIATSSISNNGSIVEGKAVRSRPPSLNEWRSLLTQGQLVEPRDLPPVPSKDPGRIIYGRVAGISVGSQWEATVTDPDAESLAIPAPGEAISFPISTTSTGTFGTDQVQSAPMLTRYPDTALQGHGNYLVHYKLTFPLENTSDEYQWTSLTFQTPIKDDLHSDRLSFFESPPNRVFYRGTVRINYPNEYRRQITRYVHLVQHRGQRSEPLATLEIPPGTSRTAEIDFFYPPDATPPQVITVRTLAPEER
ncbi:MULTISPECIES: DUF3370 domain-containing protein [Cyanophyceae]|nr:MULTISPECIES: DUF3370 domain-containing protein [Cyanophyceae]ACA99023.1 conserved hypothetical protein [Picosynechococcus sp. PCC 7002]ANV90070.1 hypothetical protein AWQ24_05195 [Picosynechococcus sp. PCC 8807]QCS49614.1 DUF3370 domain-containing protein [Picosynechococcus sp. PCC 11901]SMH35682.1 Protein of unknown function [Picosynechococcus sp. OG1]SMQ84843.1 Protein of unknown function [Synechococcus sp. 7002]